MFWIGLFVGYVIGGACGVLLFGVVAGRMESLRDEDAALADRFGLGPIPKDE